MPDVSEVPWGSANLRSFIVRSLVDSFEFYTEDLRMTLEQWVANCLIADLETGGYVVGVREHAEK